MVGSFTEDRMVEVDHAKGAGGERINVLATDVKHSSLADMGKHILEAQLPQYKLDIVGVRAEIFQSV